MRSSRVAVVGGLALGLWTYQSASAPQAEPYGQIIFVAVDGAVPETAEAFDGELIVSRCVASEEGVEVSGSVRPNGGVVAVLVWPGVPDQPGVAVGAGFLADSKREPNATAGDFSVVIPWADLSSRFAIGRAPDPNGTGAVSRSAGPTAGCPPRQ